MNYFVTDQDNAEPSANSVAVRNLRRLGVLLGRVDYTTRARDVCTAFGTRLNLHPYVLPAMASECVLMEPSTSNAQVVWVCLFELNKCFTEQVVLTGDSDSDMYRQLVHAFNVTCAGTRLLVGTRISTSVVAPSVAVDAAIGAHSLCDMLNVNGVCARALTHACVQIRICCK
jgi:uncharacterized protein YyaL (SSP411 family)